MSNNEKERKAQEYACQTHLYHWYLYKKTRGNGIQYFKAHGVVTGHRTLPDTMEVNTSRVENIEVDRENEQIVIQTYNTEYHCRISDCDFSKSETYELIPELTEYVEKYGQGRQYEQEDDTILLVLSDHESYCFETVQVKENGIIHKGTMYPHIGTFEDSCLISCEGSEKRIDIRYFPYHLPYYRPSYWCLETYAWKTGGLPVYLENDGDSIIHCTIQGDKIELNPGERKLVSVENAVEHEEKPVLDQSDLYPVAPIIAKECPEEVKQWFDQLFEPF